jgi:hypothetical protein
MDPNSPVAMMNDECTPVRSSEVSVALTVDAEPTPEDYEKLCKQTHDFFVLRLKKVFPKQFVELQLQIASTDFGAEKPEPKYNVYVEWDIKASFTSSACSSSSTTPSPVPGNKTSAPVDSNVPSPAQMCKSLLTGVDYFEYLVNSVRTIEDSVFAEASAVHAQQRIGAK